jgi:hypothetical protein
MNIYPKDGMIELNEFHRSINLTCTVRELTTNPIDPSRLKWYHQNEDIHRLRPMPRIHSYSHQNQASSILSISYLSFNDTGVFRCVYDHDKLSKNVHLYFTSAGRHIICHVDFIHDEYYSCVRCAFLLVLGYSKSISSQQLSASCLSYLFIQIISFFVLR